MKRDQVKPPPFRYAVAETIAHATELLEEEGGHACILAGGQSLIPLIRQRLTRPSLLVDIGRIKDLRSLTVEDGVLRLGACVTHRAVERWAARDRPNVVAEAMTLIGHLAVRTLGTVGGSLAYADPGAEWAAVALALDAECDIAAPTGRRTIAVEELATGPFTTVLNPSEMITEVRLTLPEAGWGSAFCEVSSGAGEQAIVGVAVVLGLNEAGAVRDVRIGMVGAGPKATRARAAEAFLDGELPATNQINEASALVHDDVSAYGDAAASAAFRRRLAPVVTKRALLAARQRAAIVALPEDA